MADRQILRDAEAVVDAVEDNLRDYLDVATAFPADAADRIRSRVAAKLGRIAAVRAELAGEYGRAAAQAIVWAIEVGQVAESIERVVSDEVGQAYRNNQSGIAGNPRPNTPVGRRLKRINDLLAEHPDWSLAKAKEEALLEEAHAKKIKLEELPPEPDANASPAARAARELECAEIRRRNNLLLKDLRSEFELSLARYEERWAAAPDATVREWSGR